MRVPYAKHSRLKPPGINHERWKAANRTPLSPRGGPEAVSADLPSLGSLSELKTQAPHFRAEGGGIAR